MTAERLVRVENDKRVKGRGGGLGGVVGGGGWDEDLSLQRIILALAAVERALDGPEPIVRSGRSVHC